MSGRSSVRLRIAAVVLALAAAAPPALAHASAQLGSTAAVATNETYGGFDVSPVAGLSSDSSTILLPKHARCAKPTDYEDLLLGEQMVSPNGDFYDQGITDAQAAVSMMCTPGASLKYVLDAFIYGPNNTVVEQTGDIAAPGDRVSTSVQLAGDGMMIATTIDETTGQEETAQAPSGDENGSGPPTQFFEGALVGVGHFMNCSQPFTDCTYRIPVFRSIRFSGSQAGGVPLRDVDSTSPQALDQDGPVQLKPSTPTAEHPGAFTLTEKHHD